MSQEKSQGGESNDIAQGSVVVFRGTVTDNNVCKSCILFIEAGSRRTRQKVRYIETSSAAH